MNAPRLAAPPAGQPGHPDETVLAASAALQSALARVAGDARATAGQDGLDLLAVIAGLKPVCVIGRGARNADWTGALSVAAARAALPAIMAAPWDPDDAVERLPRWYLAATARRREARPVLYLCRDDVAARGAAALSAKGRVGAVAEAAVLGYPPCCVAQHHARALALEDLVAAMTERVAKGDRARMMRMIEAGAAPLPTSRQEWQLYAAATAIAPAAGTSVNMCDACAADRDSPAQALSRSYRALAGLAHYSWA